MKVTVSFECNSAEEAVQLLGLNLKDGPVVPVVVERNAAPKPAEKAPAEGAKRGRGRPPKNSGGATPPATEGPQASLPAAAPAPKAAAPVATAPESVTVAPAATTPAAAAVVSDSEVKAALQKVLDTVGMPKVKAIFARFGVSRGSEVKPDRRADFVAYCEKVAAKQIDPEKGE